MNLDIRCGISLELQYFTAKVNENSMLK